MQYSTVKNKTTKLEQNTTHAILLHNITNTLTCIYLPKNLSHRIRPNSLSSFQCTYCLNTCEIPLSNTHPIPSYVIITCKTQIKQSKLRRHSLSRLIDFTTWHLSESLIELWNNSNSLAGQEELSAAVVQFVVCSRRGAFSLDTTAADWSVLPQFTRPRMEYPDLTWLIIVLYISFG